ncbi:MAG: hypothetical protein MJ103_09640 [Saccharofermentans sp.]|nr:hypothetical protein [Saccharofermentans sp.]
MNDYEIFASDWSSLEYLKKEAEYIAARTGYSEEDIYEYLICEREENDIFDVDLSVDIREHIAAVTGMCLFKIIFIMDAQQAFFDEMSDSYQCHYDLMTA